MQLTPEQKQLGKENFHDAVATARKDDPKFQQAAGLSRRSFLKGAAAAVPGLGAAYFGYQQLTEKDKVKVGFIGTGDEGSILITEHPQDYMDIVAVADIRPSNLDRAFEGDGNPVRMGLNRKLGHQEAAKIKPYRTYQQMLDEHPEIEAVVIAVPLSHHYSVAKYCLEQGKHVLTEKLMCWSVKQCKDLIKVAEENERLLAVGHQRHYSALYDNANFLVQQGLLGTLKFIRAQWHRNNSWPNRDSWNKPIPDDDRSDAPLQKLIRKEGYEKLYVDGGYEESFKKYFELAGKEYSRDAGLLEFLCHWRLYNKTGGGLMAELGSHQLDACSIFLGKVHPIAVQGYGGKNFYGVKGVGLPEHQIQVAREVDDHVYVTFEFPGSNYKEDPNDVVIVTYSSINTNAAEPYGESLFGSRGTMYVHNEQEVALFKERGPGEKDPSLAQRLHLVDKRGGKTVMETSESLAPSTQAAVTQGALGGEKISRGYTEEMEHFCYAVRNAGDFLDKKPEEGGLRCNGHVAMADAIMALTSNLAMKANRRIAFKDEWFDADNPATPETDPDIQKWITQAQSA